MESTPCISSSSARCLPFNTPISCSSLGKSFYQLAKAVINVALGTIVYIGHLITLKKFPSAGEFANRQFTAGKAAFSAAFTKQNPSSEKEGDVKTSQVAKPMLHPSLSASDLKKANPNISFKKLQSSQKPKEEPSSQVSSANEYGFSKFGTSKQERRQEPSFSVGGVPLFSPQLSPISSVSTDSRLLSSSSPAFPPTPKRPALSTPLFPEGPSATSHDGSFRKGWNTTASTGNISKFRDQRTPASERNRPFRSSFLTSAPNVVSKSIATTSSPYRDRSAAAQTLAGSSSQAASTSTAQESAAALFERIFKGLNEKCTIIEDVTTKVATWPDSQNSLNKNFVRITMTRSSSDSSMESDSSLIHHSDCEIFGCFNEETCEIQVTLDECIRAQLNEHDKLDDQDVKFIFQTILQKRSGSSERQPPFSLAFRLGQQLWIGKTGDVAAVVIGKDGKIADCEVLNTDIPDLNISAYRDPSAWQGSYMILANENLSKLYNTETGLGLLQKIAADQETDGTDFVLSMIAFPVRQKYLKHNTEPNLDEIIEEFSKTHSAIVLTLPSLEIEGEVNGEATSLFNDDDSDFNHSNTH